MIKQPMLAAKFDKDLELAKRQVQALRFPLFGSVKIDGIRAHICGGVAYSRKNKPIPNHSIQERLCKSRSWINEFDGELVVGKPNISTCFNRTSSGVMSRGGIPDFSYYVFDKIDESGRIPFVERKLIFTEIINIRPDSLVIPVPQILLRSHEELEAFEQHSVMHGWEGVMLRDPHGPYKQGRSTLREGWLIKVKRFEDSEAMILGYYEQETNTNTAVINEVGRSVRTSHAAGKFGNGNLGGFQVRDIHTNVEFNIGNFDGFTAKDRRDMWEHPDTYIGQIARYRYFPIGVKEKPRHPTLTGIRNIDDI